jgi:signal transduction histidine kinase/CheY-like chemotaxis protein
MTFVIPTVMILTNSYEHLDWTALITAVYVVTAVTYFARRAPYTVRALGLLFCMAAVTWLGFIRVGFQAGPGVGGALVVVSAGLLLGPRVQVVSYVLTILAFFVMGLLHRANDGVWLAHEVANPMVFANWVRSAFSYAFFAGVLSVAVMFVVSRIEGTLNAKSEALEKLRAEEAQRAQAEQALVQANQQIVQMQKLEAVGRLAAGVAHDFNNALVVILGWSDLLRKDQLPDQERVAGLDEIANAASRAARLTQQLLSFGRKGLHMPQSVALPALVARVCETLTHVLPENVRLKQRYAEELPPAWIDPGQMDQVLVNLCLNARDAMPSGGELTIEVGLKKVPPSSELPQGKWILLSVRDTGVGMDAATLRNAFEPFFTTKGELGSGLGLASVYGIVQQTGGHVFAESTLGEGTAFSLLLPIADAPPEKLNTEPPRAIVHAPATILVAEDELPVRKLMVEALVQAGYTVLDVENGDAALELARRHRGAIDLLCTDGVMPGIASRELIAGFRRLFPDAGVVVCSGHIEEQALRDVVEQRTLSFLPKPFTGRELARTVAKALEQRASARSS